MIPKRSTSGIMGNIMNTPMFQQAALNAQNVGQDKRAVGARNKTLEGLVRSEGGRLHAMNVEGDRLATRKDKLSFSKMMAKKKRALVMERFKREQESNKLANTLGTLSTVATGFSGVQNWRDRKATKKNRLEESAYRFNSRYGGNRP